MCINDVIHIYVDFVPVLCTNSPDDGLALLVAMYTIFELSFDKKGRTLRLLYSVLHSETRYLTNSVRVLIREKSIDMNSELLQRRQQLSSSQAEKSLDSTDLSNTSSATRIGADAAEAEAESEPQTQLEMNSTSNGPNQESLLKTNESLDANSTEDQHANKYSFYFFTKLSSFLIYIETTITPNLLLQSQIPQKKSLVDDEQTISLQKNII